MVVLLWVSVHTRVLESTGKCVPFSDNLVARLSLTLSPAIFSSDVMSCHRELGKCHDMSSTLLRPKSRQMSHKNVATSTEGAKALSGSGSTGVTSHVKG